METIRKVLSFIAVISLIIGIYMHLTRGIGLNGRKKQCEAIIKANYRLIAKSTIIKICECSCSVKIGYDTEYCGLNVLNSLAEGNEYFKTGEDFWEQVENRFDIDRHECVTKVLADEGISLYELNKMKNE